MSHRCLCGVALLLCAVVGFCVTGALAGYTGHYYVASNGYNSAGDPPGLPYWIYVPDNYDPARSYPLFIYLHGSGNCGVDNTGPSSHPNATALRNVAGNPDTAAFVIVPQTMGSWQHNYAASQALFELIDVELIGNQGYNIDADRVYVTGFSLGGVGAFDWIGREPGRVAAICPFAGALYFVTDTPALAANRAQVATWAFCGSADMTITPASTEAALSAQAAYGGDPLITVFAGAGHNDTWKRVRDDEPAIYWWMLAQRNGQPNDMSMFVGWEINTTETLVLNGPGDSVVRTDPYFVGYYGTGSLHVLNGATMTSRAGYVAAQKYGRANVVVNGVGSRWTNTGGLLVGTVSAASMHVANGGELAATYMEVGALSFLSGNGTIACDVIQRGALRPGDVAEVLISLPIPGDFGGWRPEPAPLDGAERSLSIPADAVGQPGSATGELTIDGDLTLHPTSVLEVELNGVAAGEYDAVAVTGAVAISGDLKIEFVGDYVPEFGDTFDIITAASRTGEFDGVEGPGIVNGRRLVVEYLPDGVRIVAEMAKPGDANGNDLVNIADFAILKNNWGATDATWEQGDFNGDRKVDLEDFVLMKQNWGS